MYKDSQVGGIWKAKEDSIHDAAKNNVVELGKNHTASKLLTSKSTNNQASSATNNL